MYVLCMIIFNKAHIFVHFYLCSFLFCSCEDVLTSAFATLSSFYQSVIEAVISTPPGFIRIQSDIFYTVIDNLLVGVSNLDQPCKFLKTS